MSTTNSRNRIDAALVSGGKDSITAAHYAHNNIRELDMIVYLDTRTGARKNREFVEEFTSDMGLQLWTLRTHESYDERVRQEHFPGPSRHFIFYNILKNRQLSKLATVCSGKELHLWTGVRKRESDRRMGNVEQTQEADRWTWHAPIHDWSKPECEDYIDKHNLRVNEIWSTLGRSADCFCGCYGSKEELWDAEAAGLDDVVDQMRSLEAEIDADDEKDVWGWGGMTNTEKRAERLNDGQMTLCSSCGIPEPTDSKEKEKEKEEQK